MRTALRHIILAIREWLPSELFRHSEVGVWYDVSDLSSMFQLSNGTTAAVIEGPVGYIADKSGNGKHATQATAASRPTLSARVNLLTKTEDMTNAVWSSGSLSSGTRVNGSVSVSAIEGYAYVRYNNTFTSFSGVFSADVVCDQTVSNVPLRVANALALVNFVAGVSQRVTFGAATYVATYFEFGIDLRNALVPGGSDATGYTVTFNKASLVPADQASLPYQRVDTATVYDTVGFPTYLKFDGVDDSLATGSIDFSAGDQMTVFAGVRKLSDAAIGMLTELSADVSGNAGSFYISAPNASEGNYAFVVNGGGGIEYYVPTTYTAPITNVISVLQDIAGVGVANTLFPRINGVLSQLNPGASGAATGNFGNYPLYIGRRAGTSLPFNGHLYSLIVRGAESTDAQIVAAESYTAGKTGVTL